MTLVSLGDTQDPVTDGTKFVVGDIITFQVNTAYNIKISHQIL